MRLASWLASHRGPRIRVQRSAAFIRSTYRADLQRGVSHLDTAMSPFKGEEGLRNSLKVPTAPVVDTGYSPPPSTNGHNQVLDNSNTMEGSERPPLTSSHIRRHSSHILSSFSETRSQSGRSIPRTTQTLPQELGSYLRLQDETTTLRVQLQQKRKNASRARRYLADCESRIEQALREASMAGQPIELDHYQQLLMVTEQARNAVGPLEQEVEDLEFRLVSEEDRLFHDGIQLHDLMSQYSHGETSHQRIELYPPEAPPSPPHYEQQSSPRASTEIFYEDNTSLFDGPVYDGDDDDAPRPRDLIEQYAPDLDAGISSFHPKDPPRPDEIELYVPESPSVHGYRTNNEEYMGSALMERSPLSSLLQHYFGLSEKHFERWLLHVHHVRQSVQEMLQLHSLSALAVARVLQLYNSIEHRAQGQSSTTPDSPSGLGERRSVVSSAGDCYTAVTV